MSEKIKVGKEREIKFNRDLRYINKNSYDINDYELVGFNFPEVGWKKVYKNFNLSIMTTEACDRSCNFCVAQLRYEQRSKIYEKPFIRNREEYIKRLNYILDLLKPLNPSVSITGGEPTISSFFLDIIDVLNKHQIRKKTITTNGRYLLAKFISSEKYYKDYIIDVLIKNNFDHINISRAHFDDEINRELMPFNQNVNEKMLSLINPYFNKNEMLVEVAKILKGTNLKPRLSCVLLKDGINSVEDIIKYIDFYSNLGFDNFIFRELMGFDKHAVNVKMKKFCEENKVYLNDIWEEIEREPKYKDFEPILNLLGYYYYVEVYKYKNNTIASERADLNQQYVEKDSHNDIIYEMVFHPNGVLSGSWIETEDVLSSYHLF